MKEITANLTESAADVLRSVPPIVLFMSGVVSVLAYSGLRLLAMVQNAG